MDVEALRTFLAVHRQRSFSQAAEALNRTQPAISHRIHALEQALGAPLFDRTSGGVVLSRAGQALLPHAERVLAAVRDAEDAVRTLETDVAGPVTLATVGTLAGPPLTGVLRRLAAEHPAVDLSLRTARSAEIGDLVRRGEAAIGLRYDRDRSPDLQSDPLGSDALRVVCAPDHRLAGAAIPALVALRDERWIAFPEIPGQREIGAAHIFALFLTRGLGEIDWTPVDSLTAQKRMVEAGFGLALMPGSGFQDELKAGTIGTIAVGDLDAGTPVFMVSRRGGFLGAAGRRLHELLRTDYAAGLNAG